MRTFCLTLSQMTDFGLFQTEKVCRQQFLVFDENGRKFSRSAEKHCGKRRNCSYKAISPFSTVFLKNFYCRYVKTRARLGKDSRRKH